MKHLFFSLFLGTISFSLSAATITWTGSDSDDWSNSSNWLPKQVPTANDDVVIDVSQPCVLYSGSVPILSLTVSGQGNLTINNGADILINSSSTPQTKYVAVEALSGGVINILGKIAITSYAGQGVGIDQGTIDIAQGGSLVIEYISISNGNGIGLVNDGTLLNDGSISISFPASYGILNKDNFSNLSKGDIQIFFAREIGIYNELGSSLSNYGNMTIKRIDRHQAVVYGIHNASTFTNSGGSITITDFPRANTHSYIGLLNTSTFLNRNGGIINVNNLDATNFSTGISNRSSFTNDTNAQIIIQNVKGRPAGQVGTVGILNQLGTFENKADITLTEVEGYGIRNDDTFLNSGNIQSQEITYCIESENSFINQTGGQITMDGNTPGIVATSIGIQATDHFENQGTITSTNYDVCAQCDYLTNSGNINFTECSSTFQNKLTNDGLYQVINASSGIEINDSLMNLSNGHIVIDSSDNYGIKNVANATFINTGDITLKKISIEGILNLSTIENEGNIVIDTAHRIGIGISQVSSGIPADTQIINGPSGVITIKNMPNTVGADHALTADTKVINKGDINIQGMNNQGGRPLMIYGELINDGNISFTDLVRNAFRVNAQGTLANAGVINIDSGRVDNYNIIQNNGNFNITNRSQITNEDTLINAGTISAFDNSGIFNSEYFLSTGVIDMDLQGAINTNGHFENRNQIHINRGGGITNSDLFIATSSSNIEIDSSSSNSIYNDNQATFDNSGDITITNGQGSQIFNYNLFFHRAGTIQTHVQMNNNDTLLISPGATLEMVDNRFQNGDGFGPGDYLKNEGSMIFSGGHLINGATFENHNTINYNTSPVDSTFEIAFENRTFGSNKSLFENKAGSELNINNVFGGHAMIRNSSTIINHGEIHLDRSDDQGIENSGKIENHSDIIVDNVEGIGIANVDTLINHSAADIMIRNFTATNPTNQGIVNATAGTFGEGEGLFVNNNNITIQNIQGALGIGVYNSAQFFNNESLTVINAKVGYQNGNQNPSTNEGVMTFNSCTEKAFSNDWEYTNNGTINVNNADDIGIANIKTVTQNGPMTSFSNNGTINITGVAPKAIECSGKDNEFVNEANGQINIQNLKNGITLNANVGETTLFQNHGKIEMSQITGAGIIGQVRTTFENHDTLIILNADSAIYLTPSGIPAVFDNKSMAYISIKNQLSNNEVSIHNMANMYNRSCATIEIDGAIESLNSPFYNPTFENHGFIIQNSSHDNTFEGTALNNGILANSRNGNTILNSLLNNGMYISPITGTYSCGDMINPFFQGPATGISGNQLYSDSEGASTAGIMNISNNSLTLDNQNQELDIFWASMTLGGCTKRIPISFINDVSSCNGASCSLNIWTGLGSDNDWHNANNWSLGSIPTACNEVQFNSGANCFIGFGQTGECLLMDVSTGVDFEIFGGLTVHGN